MEDIVLGRLHAVNVGDVFGPVERGGAGYRVVRKLGCGQFASVWLAVDEKCVHSHFSSKVLSR
jgi:hypothetical protein